MKTPFTIDKTKTAIVVIDLQKGIASQETHPYPAKDVIEKVRNGQKVVKGEIIRKRGYAKSVSERPSKVTDTKSYQDVVNPVLEQYKTFLARLLKTDGTSRFSVAVPKKIAKNAVDRNKIRRRIYSALRPFILKITPGIQGVFIMKAPVIKSTFGDISSEMKSFFVKIGIMK